MTEYSEHPIVVGVDETPLSQLALRLAIEEAHLRQRSVCIVHAFEEIPYAVPPMQGYPMEFEPAPATAHAQLLSGAIALARGQLGSDRVTGLAVRGRARDVLVDQTYDASLMVIGTRDHRASTTALIGSVGASLIAHGQCPVLIARPYRVEPPQGMGVVVGVDGSPVSDEAIAYAFEEAALRDVPVVAVHCWEPARVRSAAGRRVSARPPDQLADREHWLVDTLAEYANKYPDVPIIKSLPTGRTDTALVSHSLGAPLLVVGSHGRGGRLGLVLGSVSQRVLHQAYCPVAVVKPTDREM